MSMRRPQPGASLALLMGACLLVASGCGGGGVSPGGGGGTNPPPPTPTALSISTSGLPDAWVGQPYSYTLEATGGSPPYTWEILENHFGEAFTLSSSGVLSGTAPAAFGACDFTIQVTDSHSQTAMHSFRLSYTSKITITTAALPDGNVGDPYYRYLDAEGGLGGYKWALSPTSNPLPAGLAINVWGLIDGTPSAQGTYSFTAQVTDIGLPPQTVTKNMALVITNHLTVPSPWLAEGVVGLPYREALHAAAGTPPYTWQVSGGSLPGGLTLASNGEVSGTPSKTGTFLFDVRVSDSSAPPQTLNVSPIDLIIRPQLRITTTQLDSAVRDRNYIVSIGTEGGRLPVTIKLASGALPPGLSFVETKSDYDYGGFRISGMPTQAGAFNFTVEGADFLSPPEAVQQTYTIKVATPLSITTASIPEGWMNQAYSATLQAAGGTSPYTWSISNLPQGFTVDPVKGTISGTLSDPYSYNEWLSVTALDSSPTPQTAWANLYLKITAPLVITTTRLAPARTNAPYRVILDAVGGWGLDNWRISSGTLPAGLTLKLALNSGFAEISGTPATAETKTFTVELTSNGPPSQVATRSLTLKISGSLPRNDSPATATPISNGTIRASISPYADPASGPANPDQDYYALTANPGSFVTVDTNGYASVSPGSPIDTVIEIVNASGSRFSTCAGLEDPLGPFNQPCLNDDESPTNLDSFLKFKVPGTPGTPLTFYVHVLDWGGNARPDYLYDLVITGAN